MPNWTNEQKDAIYKDGSNIIVSAGAGSGKTAVLTHRVINKLKNTKIDRLLILTFTNLAAHEMKDRIKDELIKLNDKDNLDLIDSSYITTFDSYSLSVVKKYHYLLGIEKSVSIVDSNIIRVMEIEFLNDIFERLYKEKNEKFINLINNFYLKDDKSFREEILSINSKLSLKTDKISYLETFISENYNENTIKKHYDQFWNIILDKITSISDKLKDISYLDYNEYYEKIKEGLSKIINCKDYDNLVLNIDIKIPMLPRNCSDELKDLKNSISNILKELKNICIYESKNDIISSLYKTKDNVEIIIYIIKELDERIKNYKDLICSYEFNDIAIMAYNLVKNNEFVCNEIKSSFDEILIDEYQDTNDLQESFINLIQNNNVYMVGDIKQSIYRFRNANPYLFKNKYDNYSKNNGGIKIDLSKNFRSRKEVIDSINLIFESIMSEDFGGVTYNNGHVLGFGNTSYKDVDENLELEIYSYEEDEIYNKNEQEVFTICNDIKSKIIEKYQVTDRKNFELRNVKYGDFAILVDRTTDFDLYKKVFEYMKIPLTLVKDEVITKNVIITLIRNILNLIVKVRNKEFDTEFKYLYMSISRSFLIEENDNNIFRELNGDFINSNLFNKISELINISDITSCMLLDNIIDSFEIIEKLEKIGDITSSLTLISYIKDLCKSTSSFGYDIDDFIKFLNNIKENDFDIKYQVNMENTDSVKIMTIHKSKGLEFPICYYSLIYKKFNISDLKDKFIYDNDLGIISPYYNMGTNETIYKYILKDKYIKEEISEKIRLFYVALTRSREKIIILSPKFNNEQRLNDSIKLQYRSFYDILNSINYILEPYIKDINNIKLTKDYKVTFKTNVDIVKDVIGLNISELSIPNGEILEKHYSKNQDDLITREEYNNMQYGKKIHKIFEMIDLKNPDYSKIDKDIASKIKYFLSNDIFKNIKNSNIYKEYEFEYVKDGIRNRGIIDLMIEYEDYIDIIDYKLSNVDDLKYNTQLIGYKDYISSISKKKVNIYLFSILKGALKEIKTSDTEAITVY
ncbi:MAG: UvrD-helicase domain-containing protein [Clostridium sp.]|nr:UvrD-helicase domain-containing protein [Clostridium sp.]MCM1444756.1 UvrD-helicase domain-containing protein [Candidatus Amulumruptor caecigallinarius]